MKVQRKPFEDLIRERIQNKTTGGLTILNADSDKAVVRLYGEISKWFGIDAEQIADELEAITAPEIEVQISSLGGDVFDGIAIYNALRSHDARITTRVDSMAASIASVIAQAGDHRVMLTGSQMMIHEAWGFAMGSASDMRDLADILDKQTDIIASIYAERSGGDEAVFREKMETETWFDADEAVKAGLADEVVKPSRKDTPSDRSHTRFSDQLATVVTAVEQVADETENVVTFRSSQGKTPLSDDAVALLAKLDEATSKLRAYAEDTTDDLELEYLRFVDSTL